VKVLSEDASDVLNVKVKVMLEGVDTDHESGCVLQKYHHIPVSDISPDVSTLETLKKDPLAFVEFRIPLKGHAFKSQNKQLSVGLDGAAVFTDLTD